LFVLPSAYESFALVVIEALATGLPVVVTPVGIAPEVIVDGVNGFLVERTGDAVGERISQIAALSDDELDEWRRRARQSAETYSWREIARRYLSLADEVAAERIHDGLGRARTRSAESRASG
jgi:UDP-glucose:(heptosyl)LPS alpha-1,3-glucosyltransferase